MPILFLGHNYPEKLLSIGLGEISRNPIPHQIEPRYSHRLADLKRLQVFDRTIMVGYIIKIENLPTIASE